MHQSYFSYKLERKYPLTWFTWAAVLGGLVLTALFTLINFAANAYEPHFFYTTDANGTMAKKHWYSKPPFSWAKTPSTKCETTAIPIGMKIFSDKRSLRYELSSVVTQWNKTDNGGVKAPSLNYLSNTLRDCQVTIVDVFLDNVIDSDALTLSRALWNPRLSSKVFCSIEQEGTTRLELSVSWDPTKDGPVIPADKKTSPALWWSWGLLRWHSVNATLAWRNLMTELNPNTPDQDKPVKGYISFSPSSITDVEDKDFFKVDAMFIWARTRQTVFTTGTHTVSEWMDGKMNYSAAAAAFEGYAKAFYSFVMTELGQNASSLVAKPSALAKYTQGFDQRPIPETGALRVGDATAGYRPGAGALAVEDSTLYAQYFCQEPRRKSTGSLFVALLMADLVFLSAAWTLLNWGATAWVGHSDPHAMRCAGCVAGAEPDSQELRTLKPASDTDVPLLGPGQA